MKGTAQKRIGEERIVPLPIEQELQQSYLDYAMSVIVGRALPDVRDGLKPVQRRILYAMKELGLRSDTSHKKSARIVGETMGKYHPHGDSAIYDAMVRMAQDFSMRHPLVSGQGNFGSVDGDPAAAQRYTEARLSVPGEMMLRDIDEETVEWGPNFDDSLEEPLILPSFLPNILVNGSTGIAVGMATNMPPHNLAEVAEALLVLIRNGSAALDDIISVLPGPDFPTGGTIIGTGGIRQAYETGRGRITLRGRASIETDKKGRSRIVVTELPYALNKALLTESIANLVKAGRIEGVTEIRDESDREGIRLVLEVQRGVDADLVLKQVYARTALQGTFSVNNLALTPDGAPREYPLIEILRTFIDHRVSIVTRRTRYRLDKARAQEHLLEGLVIALGRIDEVVAIIKAAKSPDEARKALMSKLEISEIQAQGILDMRLQRLTSLEADKIRDSLTAIMKEISGYVEILEKPRVLMKVIEKEIGSLRDTATPRRTEIVEDETDLTINAEDLIPEAPVHVALFGDGTVRRVEARAAANGRIVEMATGAGGWVEVTETTNKRDILLISDDGNASWERSRDVPDAGDRRGAAKRDFSNGTVRVAGIVEIPDDGRGFVMIVTGRGVGKRMPLSEARGSTRMWKKAINLAPGDSIVSVFPVAGDEDEIMIAAASGKVLRTAAGQFRPQGRNAGGVRAMKVGKKDRVVAAASIVSMPEVCFCTENLYAKRVSVKDIPLHNRGGGGVVCVPVNSRSGSVAGGAATTPKGSVILSTASSGAARVMSRDVPLLPRSRAGIIPDGIPVPNRVLTVRQGYGSKK